MAVLMGSAALPLASGMTAQPAKAAPWIEPGNVTLRSDIEVLARYGIIPNLTTTWPLPWAQIAAGIDAVEGKDLPNYVRLAIDRVRMQMPHEGRGFAQHVEAEGRYTNRPSVVRDFSEQNRQKLYGQLSTDFQLGSTYAKISIGYQGDRHHGVALPDDTYIAQNIGNWTVYGGYVPRWWGAGWDTSLILSTNAREVPSFGITRQNPEPFKTKLLSWLGPWTFDMYVGELNDPRYIANTALINMRFAFAPLHNLEIGLSRIIMTCGSGRPCSASSLFKSFIGASEHPTGSSAPQ
ncbi:MAG TPA: capsule assembly Wzi family protein, partial [Alphaproteobacteria bacterium]|nr:capsule assembly Wzi family protein [Alphaproteobacteria bacterium]